MRQTADHPGMLRKFLFAAALSVAALNPAAADAGSIRSSDIKDCKAERTAIGKDAFKATYRGGLGKCADERAADRAADRAAKKAKRPIVGVPAPVVAAPAPVVEAPAVAAPVVEAPAPEAAPAVTTRGVGNGKPAKPGHPGNGKKTGHNQ
jgi:hypothetical protein